MADQTAHVSTSEYLICRIKCVNHEEYFGLHLLPGTDAHTIVAITQDILLRMNLSPENAKGQYYDVATATAKKGVTARLKLFNY